MQLLKFNVTVLPEVSPKSKLFAQFFQNTQFKQFLNGVLGPTWVRLRGLLFCLAKNLNLRQDQLS